MANIIPYREFLKRKELREQETGITVSPQQLHPSLFDWQKRIVTWACKVGRAAVWADTGLGKTRMQLEWLRQVCAGHGTGLILAPLAVCQQTIREGAAIGMEVRYVHDQSEVSDGFNITNYERVPKLDVSKFSAVVLDEASILKQSDGKTRKMLIDTFRDTKYRLACTATPAPNDPEELCNQAEFLGYATRVKMLATYFVHDGNIYGYIIRELLRVTKPGRIACVHVQQVVTTKTADGVVGLTDFRGDVIRAYVENGWIFHGEVTVNKNPQAQAIRTKAQALMFVTKNKDSSMSRPALADYLLMFRKPGENQVPIKNDVSNEEWIDWAQPVWWNIRETNTLNERLGREDTDERHICPLQLDFIERCIRLWSNKGELVFDPFGGIGSTVYEAIKLGRKGMSIELKPSYWDASVNLMRDLEEKLGEATLF